MIWIAFIVLIILLLSLDLVVFNKKGSTASHKRHTIETIFWISTTLSFSFAIYWVYTLNLSENINNLTPSQAVVKYITGYLIELSLSVDNLFVIAVIFSSFKVPKAYQHKVLFWGILGAIVFRALMIGAGIILIHKISWMTYIFGVLLLFVAFKMLAKDDETEKQPSLFRKQLNKRLKMSATFNGDKFWAIEDGLRKATPLFGALVMIELTDLLFAIDSIPAILAVTSDPFIVFSSNIFAVLGLRSMYFFLANMLEKFRYLRFSVFAILVFVSLKLLTLHFIKFPEWFSLLFILVSLTLGVLVSIMSNKKT